MANKTDYQLEGKRFESRIVGERNTHLQSTSDNLSVDVDLTRNKVFEESREIVSVQSNASLTSKENFKAVGSLCARMCWYQE